MEFLKHLVVTKSPSNPIHIKTGSDGCFTLAGLPRGRVRIDCTAKGYKRKETTVPTSRSVNQSLSIALEKDVGKIKKSLIKARNVEAYISEEGTLRIDAAGRVLTDAQYVEYCKEGMIKRTLTLSELRKVWKNRDLRLKLKRDLEEAGINLGVLANVLQKPDADEFDLIANVAFSAPILTRDERSRRVKFVRELIVGYTPQAREVILEQIDRISRYGIDEITQPQVWRTHPFDKMGFLKGVAKIFGRLGRLKKAISKLELAYYPELREV